MASLASHWEASEPSALALVIDLARLPTHDSTNRLNDALVFLNAYHAYSRRNKLILYAALQNQAKLLWPNQTQDPATSAPPNTLQPNIKAAFQQVLSHTHENSQHQSSENQQHENGENQQHIGTNKMAACIALAVCRLQRLARANPRLQSRLLVIQSCEDDPAQYLAIIDTAFAAKKLGITADVVCLRPLVNSVSLQQLSQLTGGLYFGSDETTESALSHLLISCLLPDQYHRRRFLQRPAQAKVDTRGLCSITREPVSIGYACSVCLAVFNKNTILECPICGTRFALPKLVGKLTKKKQKTSS